MRTSSRLYRPQLVENEGSFVVVIWPLASLQFRDMLLVRRSRRVINSKEDEHELRNQIRSEDGVDSHAREYGRCT
jgi:hypothetical protein